MGSPYRKSAKPARPKRRWYIDKAYRDVAWFMGLFAAVAVCVSIGMWSGDRVGVTAAAFMLVIATIVTVAWGVRRD